VIYPDQRSPNDPDHCSGRRHHRPRTTRTSRAAQTRQHEHGIHADRTPRSSDQRAHRCTAPQPSPCSAQQMLQPHSVDQAAANLRLQLCTPQRRLLRLAWRHAGWPAASPVYCSPDESSNESQAWQPYSHRESAGGQWGYVERQHVQPDYETGCRTNQRWVARCRGNSRCSAGTSSSRTSLAPEDL
jgi:hypothetical protein